MRQLPFGHKIAFINSIGLRSFLALVVAIVVITGARRPLPSALEASRPTLFASLESPSAWASLNIVENQNVKKPETGLSLAALGPGRLFHIPPRDPPLRRGITMSVPRGPLGAWWSSNHQPRAPPVVQRVVSDLG